MSDADGEVPEHRGVLPSRPAPATGGDALGQLLESFRPYLLAIANQDLPTALNGKFGGSDLVQETLLEAQRDFVRFDPRDVNSLRSWLRQLLRNNLADAIRRYRPRGKRDIELERSLHGHSNATNLAARLLDRSPTPGTHAVAREEMAELEVALDLLTSDERAAILFRHRDHLPFEEIGRRLGRSSEAARKVWSRSIQRLQEILATGEHHHIARKSP